ncbi:unnamed protein product [Echinostoma caproni]|uniref:Chromosome 1 open reading frame 53 n=1 Tax=Echinostoma caproni TaxID=27848 RepID=A0A183APJ3_9TREM|nr:unnamed protein product [Echinostoma caproni]
MKSDSVEYSDRDCVNYACTLPMKEKRDPLEAVDNSMQKRAKTTFVKENYPPSGQPECVEAFDFSGTYTNAIPRRDFEIPAKSRKNHSIPRFCCRNQGDRCCHSSCRTGLHHTLQRNNLSDREYSPDYFICRTLDRSQELSEAQLTRIPVSHNRSQASNLSSCWESHMELGLKRQGTVEKVAQINVTEAGVCCTHGVREFTHFPLLF